MLRSSHSSEDGTIYISDTFRYNYYERKLSWGPFLETPDNFPGPVGNFSSSFIYHQMVIIGANLSNMLQEIIKIKI